MLKKIIFPGLVLILIFIIYHSWFSFELISAGDFWPFDKSMYSIRPLILQAWDLNDATGMGSFTGPLLWIYLNFGTSLTLLGSFLGFQWNTIERIFYLLPFIAISIFSSYKLFSIIFSKNIFSALAVFIYCFNSYILMVIGGGQIAGVAMAYSLAPLVLYFIIQTFKQIEKQKNLTIFKYSIISSLILSTQIIFDLRIAYITLFAVFVFWILKLLEHKNRKYFIKTTFYIFIIPSIFTLLLNSFWIIPTALSRVNPIDQLGSAYSSLEAVIFFSFAKIENAFGLMHPNWPENIFGKVGFMKPEFLFLPLLAFCSLFFISRESLERKKYLIFFVAIGILGVFLAKGANDPFGAVYLWMFEKIPGFNMFRDPSKWYTLIAISYSMLIPYSIYKIFEHMKEKLK